MTDANGTRVLVNQVGYDLGKEKRFVVQVAGPWEPEGFSVVDAMDRVVLRGRLESWGEIREWDNRYWSGDFSEMRKPGTFRIEVSVGSQVHSSPPFEAGESVLLVQTGEMALRFFRYQRCGTAVQGWHGPCHMDDGVMPDGSHRDVSGGWHDAGDYNKYNGFTPLAVFSMAYAYDSRREYFEEFRTEDGLPTILDEAIWGARWLMKMHPKPGVLLDRVFSGYSFWGRPEGETDNLPGTGDERPILGVAGPWASALTAAGLAKLSALPGGEEGFLTTAESLWKASARAKPDLDSDAAMLLANEALHMATGSTAYLQHAGDAIERILTFQRDDGCLVRADGSPYYSITTLGFPTACLADIALREPDIAGGAEEAVAKYLDYSIAFARNPFEISTIPAARGPPEFFYRYADPESWYVGQNSQYLSQAWAGLLCHALTHAERYRRYALSQLNWVLGTNPFGICMFEGRGSVNPGVYHHRYDSIPGRERGAVPGCVPNGIVRASVERDAPKFDTRSSGRGAYQSNEPWLPHNAFYLLTISSL